MNKRMSYKALLFLLVLPSTYSCSETKNKSYPTKTHDSELTLLMRQMYIDALASKESIIAETKPEPLNHTGVLSAESTQPQKAQSELYQIFAQDYLGKVNELNNAKQADRIELYQNMINSCINCHNSTCPGPLVKIKPLKFPE